MPRVVNPAFARRRPLRNALGLAVAILAVLVSGCGRAAAEECPVAPRVDLSMVDPSDARLPFRYPLDVAQEPPRYGPFCEHRGSNGGMFHAAEDFGRPAGSAVYAIADGEVSFSGTMGGYGWLVIVDHPEINVYSLYGHLSPSRWRAATGPVAKGELIGYLGDEWENGGTRDAPLVAHLHLGVRAGQRSDYPGKGEWRWMGGWINLCPADLGWLQPSAVIAGQRIPEGGFAGPAGGLVERWSIEILLVGAVLLGGTWWIVAGIRRRKPVWLLVLAVAFGGVTWFLEVSHFGLIAPVGAAAIASLLAGIVILVRVTRPAA